MLYTTWAILEEHLRNINDNTYDRDRRMYYLPLRHPVKRVLTSGSHTTDVRVCE